MKKLQTTMSAAALAVAFAATGVAQGNAAPLFVPKTVTAQSDVIQVRDGVRWRNGWYNGHRGYRNFRPGYRYNNGFWFPGGAFVAGALIGGALANNNYYGGGYYNNGYYGNNYYGGGYYPRYYTQPRAYYPGPGASYREGYRAGFRDGVNARYYNGITCTQRLADAGKC